MRELRIKMAGITKIFSTDEMDTHALRGIDLEIYSGDFVSICGPSGCGKSTLLSILGLLDMPSNGQYLIEDKDVSRLSLTEAAEIRNAKIGFIFQSFNLIDELSVFDNVALPLRYAQHAPKQDEIEKRVMQCLEKVDMAHRAKHKPNQLSGGQQQRVAIARALIANPAILLVDEPTGNLDSKNGDAVMAMLMQLNKEGTTLCMVTHDPRYAEMANRKLHLLDGQITDKAGILAEAS
ncbi:ABC transporter ATP-binding protein [Rheinheimera sp. EpRS3]|uniref:ABC transporter ATP-binding protein n=1 Tax=Rheinheimera sp. EpRS3 TaxID=1712383 RepID=UPI00074A4B17|nr:ABC transporter ATP-binding protein [Rheinheimera sp. EpRS3]KUM54372.1 ABC transporter ATP-binding protein [Rheinheimera sp. EpRS3]